MAFTRDSQPATDDSVVPRAEVRHENMPAVLDRTVRLEGDVIFLIRPETIEGLARAKQSGAYDQWLEFLGLKMLNEDKLHIVIDARPERPLGQRSEELRLKHKRVYLGWSEETFNRLPRNCPVIQFEKLVRGQMTGELLREETSRRINVVFDIFDGTFLAALRYARSPGQLEALAGKKMNVITSATAADLGLVIEFFRSYVIIAQAA